MTNLVVVKDYLEKTTPSDYSRDPSLRLEKILAEFEIDTSEYNVDIGDYEFGDNGISGSTTLGDIATDDKVSIFATLKNESGEDNEADDGGDGEEDVFDVRVHIRNKEGIQCKTTDEPFPSFYTLDEVFEVLGIYMDISENGFLVNNKYFGPGELDGEEKLSDLQDKVGEVVVVAQSVSDMENPNNPEIRVIPPNEIEPSNTSLLKADEIHISKRQKTHR
ncbi:hypothetical protein COEREDRAFT_6115 [Coemansia reversa NRRL 1564]|uniref:Uncharacterized protein n=1 Tax=Coemansia reversa (strain ATCC 12441 / NRRL 1564) TaxID=763665 RepID=A0A2G5BIY8_COERN|nr:hypothetical protein COEREDRAFT_6115 [Coemansia reversa NRRL 1564]|eukprot:PIA18951.1 hypothetical protein COEREDRAFT_6115 [Coemansia reversa NRRL 1564]